MGLSIKCYQLHIFVLVSSSNIAAVFLRLLTASFMNPLSSKLRANSYKKYKIYSMYFIPFATKHNISVILSKYVQFRYLQPFIMLFLYVGYIIKVKTDIFTDQFSHVFEFLFNNSSISVPFHSVRN